MPLVLGFSDYLALLRTQRDMGLLFRKERPCVPAHTWVHGQASSGAPSARALQGCPCHTDNVTAGAATGPGWVEPGALVALLFSARKAVVWGSLQVVALAADFPPCAVRGLPVSLSWAICRGRGWILPPPFSALREESPPCSWSSQSPPPRWTVLGPPGVGQPELSHSQTQCADTGPERSGWRGLQRMGALR